jgi:hypothetical protein
LAGKGLRAEGPPPSLAGEGAATHTPRATGTLPPLLPSRSQVWCVFRVLSSKAAYTS